MKKHVHVYNTIIEGAPEPDVQNLTERWTQDNIDAVKEALSSNTDLPNIFPQVVVMFAGRQLLLEDLRGVDLSGLQIGDYDLTYCALDYSKLDNCTLCGTYLQYSRLVGASLRNAKLKNVQASPIDARLADLSYSLLSHCYISNSDLEQINLLGADVDNCDFTESNVRLPKVKVPVYASLAKVEEQNPWFNANNFREFIVTFFACSSANIKKETSKFGTVVVVVYGKSCKVGVVVKYKSKTNREKSSRNIIYSIKSSAEEFKIGDKVEIVKTEQSAERKRFRAGIFHFSSNNSGKAHKKHKTNKGWMIARVLQDKLNELTYRVLGENMERPVLKRRDIRSVPKVPFRKV